MVASSLVNSLVTDFHILGDSLSDVNNLASVLPPDQNFLQPPYFFPGQFTNGSLTGGPGGVWTGYFAQELGIDINSFYENPPIANDGDGINFALGGATSGTFNIGARDNVLGFAQQVQTFTAVVNDFSDDLIVTWIGANDYLAAGLANPNMNLGQRNNLVRQVVQTNIGGALNTLLQGGAEVIVVPNLPDLSQTPLGTGNSILDDLTVAHNQSLLRTVNQLRNTYREAKLIYVDIYTEFNNILSNSSNPDTPVTDTNLYVPPGVNPFDPTLTSPADYMNKSDGAGDSVWWDSVHPTTYTHSLLADHILNTIQSQMIIEGDSSGDFLIGKNGKEFILGYGGVDMIWAGTGNDLIDGGLGNDHILGAPGNDTAIYEGLSTDFVISGTTNRFTVVNSATRERDILSSVESLQFQDGVFPVSDFIV